MKFKVGDKVTCAYEDTTGVVVSLGPTGLLNVEWSDEEIRCYGPNVLKLVQPEVAKEPIPGKSYKTKDGDKLHFIGKTRRGVYIYDDIDGDLREYSKPFQYWTDDSDNYDIVGEWVDSPESQIDEVVLPAVEVKQWAVVMTTKKRGDIESLHDNFLKAKEYATCAFKDGAFEIVELTGTLPERKVTK